MKTLLVLLVIVMGVGCRIGHQGKWDEVILTDDTLLSAKSGQSGFGINIPLGDKIMCRQRHEIDSLENVIDSLKRGEIKIGGDMINGNKINIVKQLNQY